MDDTMITLPCPPARADFLAHLTAAGVGARAPWRLTQAGGRGHIRPGAGQGVLGGNLPAVISTQADARYPLFAISEDHEALRAAVRAVAEDKIAPHAAEVDETGEYPQAAHDALVASDFHAPHIPEEYGRVGADALDTCIVIEEVARRCASPSLIPAVNTLGPKPLL